MIGRIVAQYPRAEQRGAPYPFIVTHDPLTHAPCGLHRVYVNGREIGRLLSCPSTDDCERMLRPAPPREIPPLAGYTASTKARQRSGDSERTAERRRAEPQVGDYGRLSDAVALP